eukprot:XP_001705199.1 Hypothetical protein GL50803_8362 [Giardia lamblia ATCC 50803]
MQDQGRTNHFSGTVGDVLLPLDFFADIDNLYCNGKYDI